MTASAHEQTLLEVLVTGRVVPERAAQMAVAACGCQGIGLGRALLQHSSVNAEAVCGCLTAHLGVPFVLLPCRRVGAETLALLPAWIIRRYRILPVERREHVMTAVMGGPMTPSSAMLRAELEGLCGLSLSLGQAFESDLVEAVHHYCYGMP